MTNISANTKKENIFMVEKETDKAIGIQVESYNSFGYGIKKLAWFPKSLCSKVNNDFYANIENSFYEIPEWLISKKSKLEKFSI